MEEINDGMKMLRHEEYRYQRLVDAARNAQDSVSTLANVIDELVSLVRESNPEAAMYAESTLSRIPFLRKMPLAHNLEGEYRYVVDLPYMMSPFGENIQEAELRYLRKLQEDRYGTTNRYRFVRQQNGLFE